MCLCDSLDIASFWCSASYSQIGYGYKLSRSLSGESLWISFIRRQWIVATTALLMFLIEVLCSVVCFLVNVVGFRASEGRPSSDLGHAFLCSATFSLNCIDCTVQLLRLARVNFLNRSISLGWLESECKADGFNLAQSVRGRGVLILSWSNCDDENIDAQWKLLSNPTTSYTCMWS